MGARLIKSLRSNEVAMSFLPSVVHAEYSDKFGIRLTFNDGTIETVDFSQWLEGPVFEPLHDAAFFRRFFVEAGTVSWPNGADIAPETLYEEQLVKNGSTP